MKSRFVKTLILALVIVGGIWILSNRDKIKEPGDVVSLIKKKLNAVQASFAVESDTRPGFQAGYSSDDQGGWSQGTTRQPQQFVNNVIRIGSFKLNPSATHSRSALALDVVANICKRYDAIAIQEIDARDIGWLASLTDRMNSRGASADASGSMNQNRADYFFVSDRAHNPGRATQSAIVFNRRTLELDMSQWYTVNDPDEILSREPLVAWFRVRGPSPDQAFTFTLVNLKIEPAQPEAELAHLGELFRVIRNDGRGEDDVVIAGDFRGDIENLQALRKQAGLTWVVSNRPTMTQNATQFDNLVFSDIATVEFTGRSGAFDFLRHYNMRLDEAQQISEHMPVWAEFSVFEGIATQLPVGRAPTKPRRVVDGEIEISNKR